MKNIIIGSLQHEGNTLTTVLTVKEDFSFFKGIDMIEKVSVASTIKNRGYEIIPTIYANALPSGRVERTTYEYLLSELLKQIPDVKTGIAGVWLFLHGSMELETGESGDAVTVEAVRTKVGPDIPIAIVLDFHAGISERLLRNVNIICGYRTVPHIDIEDTQIRAANLLIDCIEKKKIPESFGIRVPIIVSGDALTTNNYPGTAIIKKLIEINNDEKIICASYFNGQPWVDAPHAGAAVVMVAEKQDEAYALQKAGELRDFVYSVKDEFKFKNKTASPEASIDYAVKSKVPCFFISDTGDNTTGGAPGDNASFLKLMLKKEVKKALVIGITDSKVIDACNCLNVNDRFSCSIGATLDKRFSESIDLDFTYKGTGYLRDYSQGNDIKSVLLECEGISIIVTQRKYGCLYADVFERFGIKKENYKIIVVKLGYLWPEIEELADDSILALTAGATPEKIETVAFSNIKRPMYPFDKDFNWAESSL